MWLVKVPKFLADHWMELGKTPGADLGFVTVEQWASGCRLADPDLGPDGPFAPGFV